MEIELAAAAKTLRDRANELEAEGKIHDWEDLAQRWLGRGQLGRFVAMMSPDVALALADLLDGIAEFNEHTEGAKAGSQVLALAHAILQGDQP